MKAACLAALLLAIPLAAPGLAASPDFAGMQVQPYDPPKPAPTFSLMPQAKLVVISDSRHATPVDSPVKFNEVVDSFLLKQNGV